MRKREQTDPAVFPKPGFYIWNVRTLKSPLSSLKSPLSYGKSVLLSRVKKTELHAHHDRVLCFVYFVGEQKWVGYWSLKQWNKLFVHYSLFEENPV